ncbi:KpsF/GutQ family protein [Moraxella macacae 0408225]|uniref:Arabinose 5-phosphate isomerase n=1 Tax=Moraxella macacae 0408225 TaxID=1230338 RepID=L2F704_9GAMM|nr:KpsF/GutQ family sugar-phosphate isomerase [Moraxella macacae]ELA08864.1 KpsF/GutQ family protein [Moraxella macacae 0408225]
MNQTTQTTPKAIDYLTYAKEAIETERHALQVLIEELDDRFVTACELLENCQGRVVVTGMGKSGHIGRKIAATFASTGTPSFFMHPAEGGHGDLGMLVKGDVLVAISNSGQSDEIRTLLPVVEKLNIPLISISRTKQGILPQSATVALTLGKSNEACPLGLAPTSSTTATLALGDALAVALVHSKNFTLDDFALSHPAGALGKRLLTRVSDMMHAKDLPIIAKNVTLKQALFSMTGGRLGITVIVNEQNQVVGVFTDGDLRRALAKNITLTTGIAKIMTKNPKHIDPSLRASDALTQMNEQKVNQLLVLNQDKTLAGIIGLHDLLQAGLK